MLVRKGKSRGQVSVSLPLPQPARMLVIVRLVFTVGKLSSSVNVVRTLKSPVEVDVGLAAVVACDLDLEGSLLRRRPRCL